MCLPLALWLAARSRAKVAWLTLSASLLFIIVASLSRGAWLGVLAGGLVAFVLAAAAGLRPTRRVVIAATAILVVALAVPLLTPMRTPLLGRLGQLTDVSATTSRTRVELWSAGLRMFSDHPILGVGLDAFLAAFPGYRTATLTQLEWGGTPAKAHNDAVQILATQGLLGGLAALAIVALTALLLWRLARRGNPDARLASIAAGAALAGYAASSFVGFGTVATSGLAAALAGWAARAGHGPHSSEGAPVRSMWNLLGGLALSGLLWLLLVGRPLRAEMYLAEALRYPSGNRVREELLRKADASAPWDPRYIAEMGRSLFYDALREQDAETRLTLIARAREALSRSVQIAPENGENRILFATILSAQSVLKPGASSKEEVRDEFRRAVERDPLSPVVLVAAERGLIAAGLQPEARELALRCARAYPDYGSPLADLGALALEEGRTAAAADTLKLAVRRDWHGDVTGAANAWNDLASASLALGQNQQAADAADSALAQNPNLGQAFATKQAALRAMSVKGKPAGAVR
jgi:tetratricopeptide (TPR) repeat protein